MEFIHEIIGKYIASRWDIPDEIKKTVKTKAINGYMERAQDNPEDFAHKPLVVIVDEIMKEIQEKHKDITKIYIGSCAAGGSRRRRRHRRSTRTSKKRTTKRRHRK